MTRKRGGAADSRAAASGPRCAVCAGVLELAEVREEAAVFRCPNDGYEWLDRLVERLSPPPPPIPGQPTEYEVIVAWHSGAPNGKELGALRKLAAEFRGRPLAALRRELEGARSLALGRLPWWMAKELEERGTALGLDVRMAGVPTDSARA